MTKESLILVCRGDFVLHHIVTLMAEGEVSLLRAPALYGDDPDPGWVGSQLRLFSLDMSGLLEECLSTFAAHYSNMSAAQLPGAVEAEISNDLLRMQTQPSIMESYRRFVVVKGTSSRESDLNKDGVRPPWLYLGPLLISCDSSNGPPLPNSTLKMISSKKQLRLDSSTSHPRCLDPNVYFLSFLLILLFVCVECHIFSELPRITC